MQRIHLMMKFTLQYQIGYHIIIRLNIYICMALCFLSVDEYKIITSSSSSLQCNTNGNTIHVSILLYCRKMNIKNRKVHLDLLNDLQNEKVKAISSLYIVLQS
jgi:hypothetical protein